MAIHSRTRGLATSPERKPPVDHHRWFRHNQRKNSGPVTDTCKMDQSKPGGPGGRHRIQHACAGPVQHRRLQSSHSPRPDPGAPHERRWRHSGQRLHQRTHRLGEDGVQLRAWHAQEPQPRARQARTGMHSKQGRSQGSGQELGRQRDRPSCADRSRRREQHGSRARMRPGHGPQRRTRCGVR